MKNVFALISVAGLCAGASAQSAVLDHKVSTDGGATWANSVDALPGSVVTVGMFANWTGGHGFGSVVCNITGDGLAAGDGVSGTAAGEGRQVPFNFGAEAVEVFMGGGAFRVDKAGDAANDVNNGISMAQRDPASAGVNFSTANPAFLFMFHITLGAAHANGDVINITTLAAQVKRNIVGIYTSATATRTGGVAGNFTIDGASIRVVVPTPASLALVGLGGLVATRRRSR